MKVKVKSLSRVRLFVIPWTVVYQVSLSIGFSRQEYWSGLTFPSPGDLPDQGSNPGLLHCRQTLYPLSHQGRVNISNSMFVETFIFLHHPPSLILSYCTCSEWYVTFITPLVGYFHGGTVLPVYSVCCLNAEGWTRGLILLPANMHVCVCVCVWGKLSDSLFFIQ